MSSVLTPIAALPEGLDFHSGQSQSFHWLTRIALREVGQRVIEAGCDLGSWTRLLLNREQVVALDPHPTRVAGLLARYSNYRNLDALTMEIEAPRFRDLARFRPDSVLCVDTLAQVKDDQRALYNFTTVLPRGRGRVVLLVPACPSLYGSLDVALGHERRYSKESLRKVAESVGLRVKELRYVNVAGFFGWWFDNRILEAAEVATPTAFREKVVPYLERIERFIAPPFGQSLFAVL